MTDWIHSPRRLKCFFFSFRVKPAAFDLFLGGCIAAYLGIVYYAIQVCSWNLWYRPDKACVCTTSLQTALHLVFSLLKCWLMCLFFPLPCLFPLPEFWLSLHNAQSGSEIQTPVNEDWTPCSPDCAKHKCEATGLCNLYMHSSFFFIFKSLSSFIMNCTWWIDWNKYEASAISQEWNQNYGFDLKIQWGSFLPAPVCDGVILFLCFWWQRGINVAARNGQDPQWKQQPVPVTENFEWETKAPCGVGWIINS